MQIPAGLTEKRTVEIISEAARVIGPLYRFGYHSREDMIQQGIMEGVKVLNENKFQPKATAYEDSEKMERALRVFMRVHIRNRLSNYRRKHSCRYYGNEEINRNKYNIMHPAKIGEWADILVEVENERDGVEARDLISFIRSRLDQDTLRDFLRVQNGVTIPSVRRNRLLAALREIMQDEEAAETR